MNFSEKQEGKKFCREIRPIVSYQSGIRETAKKVKQTLETLRDGIASTKFEQLELIMTSFFQTISNNLSIPLHEAHSAKNMQKPTRNNNNEHYGHTASFY